MNPNNYFRYGLLLLATLWLGCDSFKLGPDAVQEHATRIKTLSAENAALLQSNAVGEATITAHVKSLSGDSADVWGWMAVCVEDVAQKRGELLGSIRDCHAKLDQFAGKDAQLGTYNEPNEYSSTQNEIMGDAGANGGRGNGMALKLRTSARDLQKFMDAYMRQGQLNIDIPLIAEDESGTRWEPKHFGSATALLAIEELELLTQDALKMEATLVNGLLKTLHLEEAAEQANTQKVEGKIALRCTPVSKVVPAGMKAEANLSIDNLQIGATVEYLGGGVTMKSGSSIATLTVTAPAGFAKGTSEKPLTQAPQAKVTLPDGTIQELKTECRFTIRQPVAVITPSPDKPLRRGQKNQLTIDVPDLGEFYSPQVEATEATLQPSASDKRKFTIIPTGTTTSITINSLTNGQRILVDRVTYQVK